MNKLYLEIALPVPLRRTFDYLANFQGDPNGLIGCRVQAPFGNQTLIGIIIGVKAQSETPADKMKDIHTIIDDTPLISHLDLQLFSWAANYYHHSLGEVLHASIPQKLRQGERQEHEQLISAWKHTAEGMGLPETALNRSKKQQEIHRYLLQNTQFTRSTAQRLGFSTSAIKALKDKNLIEEILVKDSIEQVQTNNSLLNNTPLTLNQEQTAAQESVIFHRFGAYLLDGVTGSGKTEVYLQLVARALQAGTQALVLIPEIGLSPQTVGRFKDRFSVEIAELHSSINEAKRAEHWQAAKSGRAKIVIGTRLAALAALNKPGIIIVDEEHDLSYKQHDGFRYSARDICVYRAKQHNIPVVLGSATPSLETLNNAITGRYQHLKLTQRASTATPPHIESIDIRDQQLTAGLCESAIEEIRHTLQRQQQALVFLNRRGFAPSLFCHHCGWQAKCTGCELPMTFHSHPRHLHCHRCDRQNGVPRACPSCKNQAFSHRGSGTEQIELFLAKQFPNTPVIRIDRDTTSSKKAMQKLLEPAYAGTPCILVGTQMLAKGHHIPGINLAVIADADQGLMSADYRGVEQVGQLVTQVAGRAGRASSTGKVLIQTHQPDHPLMRVLIAEGYNSFAVQLLAERKHSGLPPYGYSALIRSESKRPENALAILQLIHSVIKNNGNKHTITTIGPMAAPIEKIGNRFRFQYQLFCNSRKELHATLKAVLSEVEVKAEARRTRWSVDIDPVTSA